MFSCEYCETFKNSYFEKHLRTVASKDIMFFLGHALLNVSNADIPLTTETLSSRSIRVSWEDYHNNVTWAIDDPSYKLSLIGRNKSFKTNSTQYVVKYLNANTSYSFRLCVANQTSNFSCIEGRNTTYPAKGEYNNYNYLCPTNSDVLLKKRLLYFSEPYLEPCQTSVIQHSYKTS